MVIIDTFIFPLGANYQQLHKGSLIHLVCAYKEKKLIFPSKISPWVTFKTTKYLKGCTKQHRNNLIKTSEKLGYLVLTQYIDTCMYGMLLF